MAQTSVGIGKPGPVPGGPRKAMPVTEMPDRRSPNDQRDYGDDPVAGIDPGTKTGELSSWNPGNQSGGSRKSWNPGR